MLRRIGLTEHLSSSNAISAGLRDELMAARSELAQELARHQQVEERRAREHEEAQRSAQATLATQREEAERRRWLGSSKPSRRAWTRVMVYLGGQNKLLVTRVTGHSRLRWDMCGATESRDSDYPR